MLNIYDYDDYRAYINDYLQLKQASHKAFSLRAFAKKINLSPGHLSLILSGKKNLSEEHADVLCDNFKFTDKDRVFFHLLVEYAHSSLKVKDSILRKINIEKSKSVLLDVAITERMSKINWYHLYILIAFGIVKTIDKLENLMTEQAGIEKKLIRQSISDLLAQGLLKEEGESYKRTSKRLVLSSSVQNSILKTMHLDYLKKNEEFVSSRGTDDRYSITEFISIPEDKYDEVKKLTNEYLDELTALNNPKKKSSNNVFGICLHINRFKA